jgi:hypothetical protein
MVGTRLHPLVYILVVMRCTAKPGVSGYLRDGGQRGNASGELHGEYMWGATKMIQHKIADVSGMSYKGYT